MDKPVDKIADVLSSPTAKAVADVATIAAVLFPPIAAVLATMSAGSGYVGARRMNERMEDLSLMLSVLYHRTGRHDDKIAWLTELMNDGPRGLLMHKTGYKYVTEAEHTKAQAYRAAFRQSLTIPGTSIEEACYLTEVLDDLRGVDLRMMQTIVEYTTSLNMREHIAADSKRSVFRESNLKLSFQVEEHRAALAREVHRQSLSRLKWMGIIVACKPLTLERELNDEHALSNLGVTLIKFLEAESADK